MPNSFKTVLKEFNNETLNQGSKFLSYVAQISSIEEAKQFVLKLRKEHPFASHVCFAFSVIENGNKNIKTKCSDDKEPIGTAGKPMLDVLINGNFNNTIVCVVRYFGGTLLGASNLSRAYVNAVVKCLENAKIINKVFVEKIDITVFYNEVNVVEKFLNNKKIKSLDTQFLEDVVISVGFPVEQKEELLLELNNLLSRNVEFEEQGKEFLNV